MAEAFVAQNPDCVQPNHPAQTRLKSGSSRPTSPFRAQKMQRQSGGVMKLDRSLCNANVSLTDLIKGWFVALTKQLNAYPSRILRLFASSHVKLVALAS